MTSPALQERREVVKAARRDAELAERFHDKQWHKRRPGRHAVKPLSLEGPTNEEHIALYRMEKGLGEERNRPKIEAARAIMEEQRQGLAAAAAPHRGGRPKGSKTVNVTVPKVARPSPTHFKCGHPRSEENSYPRRRRSPKTGLPLKPSTQCKECSLEHDKTRDRRKESKIPSDVLHPYGA